ncbi:unnamed protein product [Cylicocyclus nassatus]|uniref:SCP domain-containing protein n=1 Tax=Cylicocyclus nassatus TaxID=53992 RepID=A0AA36GM24_CYLNA|nr:unnamed protein product [Cylicocyclus nassatus]
MRNTRKDEQDTARRTRDYADFDKSLLWWLLLLSGCSSQIHARLYAINTDCPEKDEDIYGAVFLHNVIRQIVSRQGFAWTEPGGERNEQETVKYNKVGSGSVFRLCYDSQNANLAAAAINEDDCKVNEELGNVWHKAINSMTLRVINTEEGGLKYGYHDAIEKWLDTADLPLSDATFKLKSAQPFANMVYYKNLKMGCAHKICKNSENKIAIACVYGEIPQLNEPLYIGDSTTKGCTDHKTCKAVVRKSQCDTEEGSPTFGLCLAVEDSVETTTAATSFTTKPLSTSTATRPASSSTTECPEKNDDTYGAVRLHNDIRQGVARRSFAYPEMEGKGEEEGETAEYNKIGSRSMFRLCYDSGNANLAAIAINEDDCKVNKEIGNVWHKAINSMTLRVINTEEEGLKHGYQDAIGEWRDTADLPRDAIYRLESAKPFANMVYYKNLKVGCAHKICKNSENKIAIACVYGEIPQLNEPLYIGDSTTKGCTDHRTCKAVVPKSQCDTEEGSPTLGLCLTVEDLAKTTTAATSLTTKPSSTSATTRPASSSTTECPEKDDDTYGAVRLHNDIRQGVARRSFAYPEPEGKGGEEGIQQCYDSQNANLAAAAINEDDCKVNEELGNVWHKAINSMTLRVINTEEGGLKYGYHDAIEKWLDTADLPLSDATFKLKSAQPFANMVYYKNLKMGCAHKICKNSENKIAIACVYGEIPQLNEPLYIGDSTTKGCTDHKTCKAVVRKSQCDTEEGSPTFGLCLAVEDSVETTTAATSFTTKPLSTSTATRPASSSTTECPEKNDDTYGAVRLHNDIRQGVARRSFAYPEMEGKGEEEGETAEYNKIGSRSMFRLCYDSGNANLAAIAINEDDCKVNKEIGNVWHKAINSMTLRVINTEEEGLKHGYQDAIGEWRDTADLPRDAIYRLESAKPFANMVYYKNLKVGCAHKICKNSENKIAIACVYGEIPQLNEPLYIGDSTTKGCTDHRTCKAVVPKSQCDTEEGSPTLGLCLTVEDLAKTTTAATSLTTKPSSTSATTRPASSSTTECPEKDDDTYGAVRLHNDIRQGVARRSFAYPEPEGKGGEEGIQQCYDSQNANLAAAAINEDDCKVNEELGNVWHKAINSMTLRVINTEEGGLKYGYHDAIEKWLDTADLPLSDATFKLKSAQPFANMVYYKNLKMGCAHKICKNSENKIAIACVYGEIPQLNEPLYIGDSTTKGCTDHKTCKAVVRKSQCDTEEGSPTFGLCLAVEDSVETTTAATSFTTKPLSTSTATRPASSSTTECPEKNDDTYGAVRLHNDIRQGVARRSFAYPEMEGKGEEEGETAEYNKIGSRSMFRLCYDSGNANLAAIAINEDDCKVNKEIGNVWHKAINSMTLRVINTEEEGLKHGYQDAIGEWRDTADLPRDAIYRLESAKPFANMVYYKNLKVGCAHKICKNSENKIAIACVYGEIPQLNEPLYIGDSTTKGCTDHRTCKAVVPKSQCDTEEGSPTLGLCLTVEDLAKTTTAATSLTTKPSSTSATTRPASSSTTECPEKDDDTYGAVRLHNDIRQGVARRSFAYPEPEGKGGEEGETVEYNKIGSRSVFRLCYDSENANLAAVAINEDDCKVNEEIGNVWHKAINSITLRVINTKEEGLKYGYHDAIEKWLDTADLPLSDAIYRLESAKPFANMVYYKNLKVGCAHKICKNSENKIAIACVYGEIPQLNELLYIEDSTTKGCIDHKNCKAVLPKSQCDTEEGSPTLGLCLTVEDLAGTTTAATTSTGTRPASGSTTECPEKDDDTYGAVRLHNDIRQGVARRSFAYPETEGKGEEEGETVEYNKIGSRSMFRLCYDSENANLAAVAINEDDCKVNEEIENVWHKAINSITLRVINTKEEGLKYGYHDAIEKWLDTADLPLSDAIYRLESAKPFANMVYYKNLKVGCAHKICKNSENKIAIACVYGEIPHFNEPLYIEDSTMKGCTDHRTCKAVVPKSQCDTEEGSPTLGLCLTAEDSVARTSTTTRPSSSPTTEPPSTSTRTGPASSPTTEPPSPSTTTRPASSSTTECPEKDNDTYGAVRLHNDIRQGVARRSFAYPEPEEKGGEEGETVEYNKIGSRSMFRLCYDSGNANLAAVAINEDDCKVNEGLGHLWNKAINSMTLRVIDTEEEGLKHGYQDAIGEWRDTAGLPLSDAKYENESAKPFANMVYYKNLKVGCAHKICKNSENKIAIACVYGEIPHFNEPLYIEESTTKGCTDHKTCKAVLPKSECDTVELSPTLGLCLAEGSVATTTTTEPARTSTTTRPASSPTTEPPSTSTTTRPSPSPTTEPPTTSTTTRPSTSPTTEPPTTSTTTQPPSSSSTSMPTTSSSPSTSTTTKGWSGCMTDYTRNQVVSTINEYRSSLAKGQVQNGPVSKRKGKCPPARNMYKMRYDQELENEAQKYASTCPAKPGSALNTRAFRGESIAVIKDTTISCENVLANALHDWWNEITKLAINDAFKYTQVLEHSRDAPTNFTQMAWAISYKVGCGVGQCPYGNLVVCRYYVRGNIYSRYIYRIGPTCTWCKRGCDNGLCIAPN